MDYSTLVYITRNIIDQSWLISSFKFLLNLTIFRFVTLLQKGPMEMFYVSGEKMKKNTMPWRSVVHFDAIQKFLKEIAGQYIGSSLHCVRSLLSNSP